MRVQPATARFACGSPGGASWRQWHAIDLEGELAMRRIHRGRKSPEGPKGTNANRRYGHFYKPRIDWLERRSLLASFTWAGGSSGDFASALNWVDSIGNSGVPGINDSASVAGSVTIGVSSIGAVASLNAPGATLNVTAGEISIGAAGSSGVSSIGVLNVSSGAGFQAAGGFVNFVGGGAIAGTVSVNPGANLTLSSGNAPYNINAGAAFQGSGQVSFSGYFNNVVLNTDIAAPQNLSMDSGMISGSGNLTITGNFSWTGGTITGVGTTEIATGAAMTIGGDTTKALASRSVRNAGDIAYSGGVLNVSGTAEIDNLSGGTFDIQVDTSFTAVGTGGSFVNESGAIFEKTGGTGGFTFLGVRFDNAGTVDVQSGSVYLDGSGTGTGAFQTEAGAGLYFSGGREYTLDHGASLLGSGQFGCVDDFSALTVNTDLSVLNLTLSDDHSTGLSGSGAVTVLHDLGWYSGDIRSHVIVSHDASFEIAGTVSKVLNGGTVDNDGLATYQGDKLMLKGTFNNSGRFDDQADNEISGGGTFNNLSGGTFTKSVGTGWTTFFLVAFNNAGTANVDTGALSLTGASTQTGIFNAGPGTQMQFGFAHVLNAGAALDGPGLYEVVGQDSSLLVNTNATVQNFLLDAQSLGGTADLGVTGNFNWISGTISGTATATAGATLDLGPDNQRSGGPRTLSGTLNNAGTANWTGGPLSFSGGVMNNFGTFALGDGLANGLHVGLVNNAGTFVKTSGIGTSSFDIQQLNNTGTVEVDAGTLSLPSESDTPITQLAGTTLTGGSWRVLNGSKLSLPDGWHITTNQADISLSGSGASFPALDTLTTNAGDVTLDSGAVLNLPGPFTQAATGTMTVELGGSSSSGQFGQLRVAGSAALGGTLALELANGFVPSSGDQYTVISFSTVSGAFATIDRLSYNARKSLVVQANATSVIVKCIEGATDLAVTSVVVPVSTSVPGQVAPITYTVTNLSGTASDLTDWTDSIYVALSDTFNDSAQLIERIPHQGGVTGHGSYQGTVTAPLPGLAPGSYHVFVVADTGQNLPDPDPSNNVAVGSTLLPVNLPIVTVGTRVSGTIEPAQRIYYQLELSGGSATQVVGSFSDPTGGALYVGFRQVPTSSSFDFSAAAPGQASEQVLIPGSQAGTYYILVQSLSGSINSQSFTLSAEALPLEVTNSTPTRAGNSGMATLTVRGSQFTNRSVVSLAPHGGGSPIFATDVTLQDDSTLFAEFDLKGAAIGDYDVKVTDGAQTSTEPSALTIAGDAPGHVAFNLTAPAFTRYGRTGFVTLEYRNDGGSDAPAPLFLLTVTTNNATLALPGTANFLGPAVEFLGINSTGPAGTLPPGMEGTITIPFESTTRDHTNIHFDLKACTGTDQSLDWTPFKSALEPSFISPAAWDAVFANLTANLGSSTAQLVATLDADATYLSQLGEYTSDVGRLFEFEIEKADSAYTASTLATTVDAAYPVPGEIPLELDRRFNQPISGRYATGPFGLGWTDNWQISIRTDEQGNAILSDDGSLRYFTRLSDGTYQARRAISPH